MVQDTAKPMETPPTAAGVASKNACAWATQVPLDVIAVLWTWACALEPLTCYSTATPVRGR